MRTEKSSKNAIISLVYYAINTVFSFVSKTIFINYLGIEYNGLNSLFLNILGVLNIAELGIGAAVGYSLYKPLAEKDTKKINEILLLYKYIYRCIAIVIFIIGIIITIFINRFVNSNISINEIRIYFIMYLFATITSYLFTFLNVLPLADQRNYFIVRIQGNAKILKTILQFIVIILYKNYYYWLIIEIISNCLMYIYTNIKIKKDYKYYSNEKTLSFLQLLKKYKNIVLKTKDLFFHKIGGLVVNQTDNIIISYFGNLEMVGIYTNYLTIQTLLSGSVEQAFIGITSSIGNLIVEEDNKKVYSVWKELHILTIFLSTIMCFLFYKLANPFIGIWVGKEYIFSKYIVFAIALNIMFKVIKQPIDKFKDAYGIFYDKMAPFIESVINLVVSIILVKNIGVLGVVVGTIVSNIIIIAMWKPYIVFKDGFKIPFVEYIKLNIPYFFLSIITIVISNVLINCTRILEVNNVTDLIIMFIVHGSISVIIATIVFMTNKYFRKTITKYISLLISNIKGIKNNKKA